MKSANPSLTPAQIEATLKQTARPASGSCSGCGAGLVDAAIFLRLECKAGNGVEIRDITAFMVLSSQDAARIEVDVPATDAREVDIRIPMRALDADGRVATGYSGLAEMDVVRDEHVMRIPLAFSEGLTDTTFKLSELGTYDVQFRCDLQEPILTAIDIYDAVLPVYEIKLQQARPIRFDSLDELNGVLEKLGLTGE